MMLVLWREFDRLSVRQACCIPCYHGDLAFYADWVNTFALQTKYRAPRFKYILWECESFAAFPCSIRMEPGDNWIAVLGVMSVIYTCATDAFVIIFEMQKIILWRLLQLYPSTLSLLSAWKCSHLCAQLQASVKWNGHHTYYGVWMLCQFNYLIDWLP